MKFFYILFLLIPLSALADPAGLYNDHAVQTYQTNNNQEVPANNDEALCGKQLDDPTEKEQRVLKRKALENSMPPISNQSPASWCYGFTTTDILNYYNFMHSGVEDKERFYSEDRNLISPIEVVHAHENYTSENRSNNIINTKEGGDEFSALLGVQASKNYKLRSMDQIVFNSLEEDNPHTRSLVKSLVERYGESNPDYKKENYYNYMGSRCPVKLYKQQSFQNEIKGFKLINEELYRLADHNNLLTNNFEVRNYNALSKHIANEPDIEIAPYNAIQFKGSDEKVFLQNLAKNLYPHDEFGMPASISVCSDDIKSKASLYDKANTACRNHAVSVVGAYYENGKCVVRLRNTWGADWPNPQGDGHVTITADELVQTQKNFAKHNSIKDTFKFTSIKKQEGSTGNVVLKSDDDAYIGHYNRSYTSTGSFYDNKEAGFTIDKNGQYKEAHKVEWKDNQFFTGKVEETPAGLKILEGKIVNQDQKIIYVYKRRLSDGSFFTGPVRNEDGQIFMSMKNNVYED